MPTSESDRTKIFELADRVASIDERLKALELTKRTRDDHQFVAGLNVFSAIWGVVGVAVGVVLTWLLQR